MKGFATLTAACLLAACAYSGPPATVVDQRATWFSYLSGDDLRQSCVAGIPDRYRLIYNASFEEQARGFDVAPAGGGRAMLHQIVERGLVVGPEPRPVQDLLAPTQAATLLEADEMAALTDLLQSAGAFEPPPAGLVLQSDAVFWLVTGCHSGRYFLTAFPDAGAHPPVFADFLRARDRTAVPWPRPDLRAGAEYASGCRADPGDGGICFTLEVGPDGLAGM